MIEDDVNTNINNQADRPVKPEHFEHAEISDCEGMYSYSSDEVVPADPGHPSMMEMFRWVSQSKSSSKRACRQTRESVNALEEAVKRDTHSLKRDMHNELIVTRTAVGQLRTDMGRMTSDHVTQSICLSCLSEDLLKLGPLLTFPHH